jgi:UDP-N-acetyl-D-mannosaminuronic acid dehydrogenase
VTRVPDGYADSEVCVIGLGYVGLTLSVALAGAGFRVHGVEVRKDALESLHQGTPHFWERGLEAKLREVILAGRFTFSENIPPSTRASVYIITVGTPLDSEGKARLDMIRNATKQICQHMQDGSLVILRSTVRIGTARNVVRPILEETGRSHAIAVCPERTLEGRALSELHELPQVVGADDVKTQTRAAQFFGFLTPTTVKVSSLEAAEVVKLVDNTYRDVVFGFSNEVARLCDAVGISALEVIRAGKLGYARTNVALPGPVGGPCLEKDPHILIESARSYGIDLDVTASCRRVNERQPEEVANFIHSIAAQTRDFPLSNPVISLLGIAFKGQPATNDLRGTMAKPVLEALRRRFPAGWFRGFDPVVGGREVKDFGLSPVDSMESAFSGAHIVIILNNHSAFSDMSVHTNAQLLARPAFIYDFWNLFTGMELRLPPQTTYYALGSHQLPTRS